MHGVVIALWLLRPLLQRTPGGSGVSVTHCSHPAGKQAAHGLWQNKAMRRLKHPKVSEILEHFTENKPGKQVDMVELQQ